MARQIFFRGEAGPARINVPQAPNIAGAGSVLNGRSPMGDLLRVADEGGRKIAGAVVAIAGRRMDGHVEDAYIEARRRFAEWQAGYNRTHQASQGLDAQADYALQWNKIAKDIREEYGGYLEGSWHRKLDRKLELGRLYATVDGARWQDQQYGAWGANQEKVQLSDFNRLVQGSPDDLARIQMEKAELVRAWRERNPGMDSTVFERGLDEGIAAGRVQALLARGDIDGAQAALTRYGSAGGAGQSRPGAGAGSGLHGAPTRTGVARVLAYHESGTQGSLHVSYGLPRTDGVDVGKYSFITKGGGGGSVGEFIRWAGKQGDVGERLYKEMHDLVGGNWGALDSHSLWKTKAAEVWKRIAKSDPEAFEKLEDAFMGRRFDQVIAKLRPEVQAAIRGDKSGALYEMAASTINQHATARKILDSNFDPNPETYIRKVYSDRGNPARFSRTADPGMGRRRMNQEVKDVLGILHSGGTPAGQPAGGQSPAETPAPQAPQHPAFGGGILPPDKAELLQRRIDSARELQTKERARTTAQDILAQTSGFTPEEQKAKAYALIAGQPAEVQAAVKPLVDSGIKFREDALDAQYGAAMAQFLELAPKLSPLDRDKTVDGLVASGKLSRKKADELRRMNKADLERTTPDREKAFEELLEAGNSRIALGAPDAMTDTSDIDREFARGRLTPQMRKDLIEMRRSGGSLKNFGKDHLDDLYCDIQGKKRGTAKMPAEMYARFFKWGAASGKPLDDDAIKRRLANEALQVSVPGRLWGTRQVTLAEAMNKGLEIQGADVPPEREELLTQEMQRLHFTPEQIKDPEIRRQAYANIIYGRK